MSESAVRLEAALHRHIAHSAHRSLVASGHYGAVVGVGIGRRLRAGRREPESVLSVFVSKKGDLKGQKRLPRRFNVHFAGQIYVVPVDVVELAVQSAEFHNRVLEPCSEIAVSANAAALGCVSWVLPSQQTPLFITAEHVVGFGAGGTAVFAAAGEHVGSVTKRAFDGKKIDAALVQAAAGVELRPSIPAHNTLGDVRYVTNDDVSHEAPSAHAFLPVSQKLVAVNVHQVHVLGTFAFIDSTGATRFPQELILTDPITQHGDSGAALFGLDWCPIGLCTGRVTATDGSVFDAFTELGPALDALGVDWVL